jgi:hypothetical protein
MLENRILTIPELEELLSDSVILEKDSHGPKVYRLSGTRILKLFRVRRLFSSNLWSPYSKRFARNSEHLLRLSIRSVTCIEQGKIPHLERQYVIYDMLPGVPVRACETIDPIKLGWFFANLHHRGLYFRSCHLGNMLLLESGEIGLIDVADLTFRRRPLTENERRRNFRHLLRVRSDKERLDLIWKEFMLAYDSY